MLVQDFIHSYMMQVSAGVFMSRKQDEFMRPNLLKSFQGAAEELWRSTPSPSPFHLPKNFLAIRSPVFAIRSSLAFEEVMTSK